MSKAPKKNDGKGSWVFPLLFVGNIDMVPGTSSPSVGAELDEAVRIQIQTALKEVQATINQQKQQQKDQPKK